MTITKEQSQLGKTTDYALEYSPQLLDAISRGHARERLPFLNLSRGFDYWHLFELSWLDKDGKPRAAIGRLSVPAGSPNIVESKSLKLYCVSLNFKRFASENDLRATVERDLTHCIKAQVKLELLNVDSLAVVKLPEAGCIDNCDITDLLPSDPKTASSKTADSSLLAHKRTTVESFGREKVENQLLHSHLFRSNCPVTNQPDWATVLVRYTGKAIDEAHLLAYLVSYRSHQGFHESCVEHIYADILTHLKPAKLMVQAWFTRRGGIDISPCRATHLDWVPKASRLARQ